VNGGIGRKGFVNRDQILSAISNHVVSLHHQMHTHSKAYVETS
jgi:hypothetical protein